MTKGTRLVSNQQLKESASTTAFVAAADAMAADNSSSAELVDLAAKDKGRGAFLSADQVIVPFITILQSNSPQCDKRRPEYLEGAAPGRLWLKGAAVDPFRDSVDVRLCANVWTYVEWLRPRGSGFVARHLTKPNDLTMVPRDDGQGRPIAVRPNGNEVIDTLEAYLTVDFDAYLMGLTSTQITVGRHWISYAMRLRHPRSGGPMPSYGHRFRLSTTLRHKSGGSWSLLTFEDLGLTGSVDEYLFARQFADYVNAGRHRVDEAALAASASAAAPISEAPIGADGLSY
jgi:hypothetical protein